MACRELAARLSRIMIPAFAQEFEFEMLATRVTISTLPLIG
jgi:hypothetical protein